MLQAFKNGWLKTGVKQDNQAWGLPGKATAPEWHCSNPANHLWSSIELNLWKLRKVNIGSSKGTACFSGFVNVFQLFQLWMMVLAFLTSWSKRFSRSFSYTWGKCGFGETSSEGGICNHGELWVSCHLIMWKKKILQESSCIIPQRVIIARLGRMQGF